MRHLPDSALGIFLLPSLGIPRWGMTEWLVVAWIRSFWGHTTRGGRPLEVSIFLLCALMGGVSPLGGVSSELHILGIFVPQNEGCFVPISQDRYLHL